MSDQDAEIQALSEDLTSFIAEFAKIISGSDIHPTEAMRMCEQHFPDLPVRIQNAILLSHCAFVERNVEGEWKYLLQYGDFMVCDCIPGHMRNAIVKPILPQLTPLGKTNEIIWYCMS